MPRETRLYKALQRRGLQVEYVPGWTTRGDPNFAPFGALAHWTAGASSGDRPSLSVVVNGRTGLPGPLAQVFLARSGVAVVVAAGRANHAGVGSYKGADGNTDVFGCECEWDGSPDGLTDAQKWAYPRVMATFMDLGAKWIAGHDEYATPRGRKVDVGSYIHTLRSQTYALVNQTPTPTPTKGFLMALSDAEQKVLFDKVSHIDQFYTWRKDPNGNNYRVLDTGDGGTLRNDIARVEATVRAQSAAIETLAKSIGIDPAGVQETVKTAVENALADITLTLTTATEE